MFYALSLNAGRLPGSIFFNMFLLSAIEIPANLTAAFLLERVGRRLTVGVSTILGGLASFLMIPFMFFYGQFIIRIMTIATSLHTFTVFYSASHCLQCKALYGHNKSVCPSVCPSVTR